MFHHFRGSIVVPIAFASNFGNIAKAVLVHKFVQLLQQLIPPTAGQSSSTWGEGIGLVG